MSSGSQDRFKFSMITRSRLKPVLSVDEILELTIEINYNMYCNSETK